MTEEQAAALLDAVDGLADHILALSDVLNDSLVVLVGAALLVAGYIGYRIARSVWGGD